MSMSKRHTDRQEELWIAMSEMTKSPGHPFYQRLNVLLGTHGFDEFVEERCERFYAPGMGRPSIPPGVYFRILLIGYFEGIDSERGIAWQCSDSLALREFLGYSLTERTPDHSSLSIIRGRLDIETHREVFQWVLKVLAKSGLVKGKTIGVDATTLEANAALRSIVRRDTGQRYEAFLTDLVERGGKADRHRLFVIDGSQALRSAIKTVYGSTMAIQRCHRHKERNVRDHRPKDQQAQVASAMKAASLREGLDEMFTINRLNLSPTLRRCLSTTNLIESSFSGATAKTGRVKRWRDGARVVRWAATALLETEKHYKKIMGYRDLWQLKAHLHDLDMQHGPASERKAG